METIALKTTQMTLKQDFVEVLIKNLRINQLRHINKRMGRRINRQGDTHSVWFDLEKLKMFITEIENKALEHEINENDLGIRFYLGAYPNKRNWQKYSDLDEFDQADQYANRTTILMMPTKKVDGVNIDVDIVNNEAINLDLDLYSKKADNKKVSSFLAANHGNAIPPY